MYVQFSNTYKLVFILLNGKLQIATLNKYLCLCRTCNSDTTFDSVTNSRFKDVYVAQIIKFFQTVYFHFTASTAAYIPRYMSRESHGTLQ